MTKQLINTNKWDQDDFRLLVVMLLIVVYPVFMLSFFALYVFVLLPVMVGNPNGIPSVAVISRDGYYHAYWLFVSLLWLLLCAIILPCFHNKKKQDMSTLGMEVRGSPEFPTKTHNVQPFVKIEETNEKKRLSELTEKSQGSSASIEKGICEEKAEKESLEKSKESLAASGSLQKRSKLLESGEFLNEYMDTLEQKDMKKLETECEVHAHAEKKRDDADSTSSDDEEQGKRIQDKPEDEDCKNYTKEATLEKDGNDNKLEDEIEQIALKQEKDKKIEALPLKEAHVDADNFPEDTDEVNDLGSSSSPVKRRKARPTIDTSGANEQYECSMPTPSSAGHAKRESNMVFLFVNPDTLSSEEGVKVVHAEEEVKQEL